MVTSGSNTGYRACDSAQAVAVDPPHQRFPGDGYRCANSACEAARLSIGETHSRALDSGMEGRFPFLTRACSPFHVPPRSAVACRASLLGSIANRRGKRKFLLADMLWYNVRRAGFHE